jgi:hypothetical protein
VFVDDSEKRAALDESVAAARLLTSFRFPPIDSPSFQYGNVERRSFDLLFGLCRFALGAVLETQDAMKSQSPSRIEKLRAQLSGAKAFDSAFGSGGTDNLPFLDCGGGGHPLPFSTSFFNLFNYQYGLLNVHKDRCLMTAIYTDPPPPTMLATERRSALWVKASDGQWENVDDTLNYGEIIFLVGEDMEDITGVHAADHCIRVDPTGPNISRSHFRCDPDSTSKTHRASAAFILSEETVSSDFEGTLAKS